MERLDDTNASIVFFYSTMCVACVTRRRKLTPTLMWNGGRSPDQSRTMMLYLPLILSSWLFFLVFLSSLTSLLPQYQREITMSSDSSQQHQCQNDGGAQTDAADSISDVYVVRHSARVDREDDGIWSWEPLSGHSRDDAHLSLGGLQASQELAVRFNDITISHIVSSPFIRCLQTVVPIAETKGIPIKVELGICEVLNAHYPPGFWSAQQLAKEFPVDLAYQPVMAKSQLKRERGDAEASKRSKRVATAVRKTLEGPILFCGHGASCLGIAEAFGDYGYVGYSSFSHYVLDGDKWQVKASGDVSHLSDKLRKQSLESAW